MGLGFSIHAARIYSFCARLRQLLSLPFPSLKSQTRVGYLFGAYPTSSLLAAFVLPL